MTLTERFRERLLARLPEGAAFRRDAAGEDPEARPGSFFSRLFGVFAKEYALVDTRRETLLAEAAPWESVNLLPDWERVFALPSTGTTLARQAAVAARLLDQGGCSIPYFEALALSLGYPITITEYLPWRVGISSCIDPLIGQAWQATWTVTYPSGPYDSLLESTLIAARPAHTVLDFQVEGELLVIDGEVVFIDGEPVVIA
jgi:hypothetical protein